MSSAICFNLDQSRIFLSGNGLSMCKYGSQSCERKTAKKNPIRVSFPSVIMIHSTPKDKFSK